MTRSEGGAWAGRFALPSPFSDIHSFGLAALSLSIHVVLIVIGALVPPVLIGATWPLLMGIPSVLLGFCVAVLHNLSTVRVMFSRPVGDVSPFASRSVPRLVRYGAVLAGLEAMGSMLWVWVAYGEGGPRETPGGAAWVRDWHLLGTMLMAARTYE